MLFLVLLFLILVVFGSMVCLVVSWGIFGIRLIYGILDLSGIVFVLGYDCYWLYEWFDGRCWCY